MSKKIRFLFFAIGVIAVVAMCLTFEVSFVELWRELCRAGYWFVAILAMWGGLYAMNTLSWLIIIYGSGPCPMSFWQLYKFTITGFALNYATPVGLLGGEPYKIMAVSPMIGSERAASSVLLFSMMHVFSHFWYWVTAIAAYIILGVIGVFHIPTAITVILSMMLLFCSAGIYMFIKGYQNGMVKRIVRLVGHIPGCKKRVEVFYEKHNDELQKIDAQISALHNQNRRSFYASFVMEFIGRAFQSFEVFFILILFGKEATALTFVFAYMILSFTSLFANLLFFLPLQLGGREGGFALSTAQMGMTNEIGIFISLICRVREIFWVAIGVALLLIDSREKGKTL